MMRNLKLLLLLLCCLLLTGCTRDPLAPMVTASDAEIPLPAVEDLPTEDNRVTLWFRFGDEPFLASESRDISLAPADDRPLAILQALLEGPGAASIELNSPFPQGTRGVSAIQSGRTMFVTLSRHIMNGYADEPDNWSDQPSWAEEVPLRRELAMQSIAATMTENCSVDSVVILVELTGADGTLRLRRSYYTLADDDTTLAEPLRRNEALLLSPARTAEIILEYWQASDWLHLHRYIARTDPATGSVRPDESAFVQQMSDASHLLSAAAQGGSITADGSTAVFTVSGAWLIDGTETPFSGMVLRLVRERGVWRVGISQLTGREALQ